MKTISKFIGKYRALVIALSCVVVFCTTYLLVLPAITLDRGTAQSQGGIDVPGADDSEVVVAAMEAPATLTCEGDAFTVTAVGTSGLPSDTVMEAEEIPEGDARFAACYRETLNAVRMMDAGKIIESVRFYDLSLLSGGRKVQPEAPLSVSIRYKEDFPVEDADAIRVIHFAGTPSGEKTAGADEVSPGAAEILDPELVRVRMKQGQMTETTFEAERFSVYAIVCTADLTA